MTYRPGQCLLAASLLTAPVAEARAADAPPVQGLASSSLSTSGAQIRQLAMDGDPSTCFASEAEAGPEDSFTITLDEPVAVRSLLVDTGRDDGTDRLDSGSVEVSEDGQAFEPIASFKQGRARAELAGRKVRAIRIRPGEGPKHPLVIREIGVEADRPVATFRYPIEFAVDVSDAPEMKTWADNVALVCERWYPRINDELRSEGYKPARKITMTLSSRYKGVAEAGGGRITGSVKFFKDHPDDLGAMIHETTHIVQRYRGRGNPGWLVEGVADYVRFFVYEPGNIGRIDPERARYNGSYRTSAAFLAYLTEKYDRQIVRKLNDLMRSGKYREEAFQEITGKPLKELGEEWQTSLKK